MDACQALVFRTRVAGAAHRQKTNARQIHSFRDRTDAVELLARKEAWADAYRHTRTHRRPC